jgi:hypothetical protein
MMVIDFVSRLIVADCHLGNIYLVYLGLLASSEYSRCCIFDIKSVVIPLPVVPALLLPSACTAWLRYPKSRKLLTCS